MAIGQFSIPIYRWGRPIARAVVDGADADLTGWPVTTRWIRECRTGSVCTKIKGTNITGAADSLTVYLHQLIALRMLGRTCPPAGDADALREQWTSLRGSIVVHENGDKLDNRRSNLRLSTFAQNCVTIPIDRRLPKGVLEQKGRFQASVPSPKGRIVGGKYGRVRDAAIAVALLRDQMGLEQYPDVLPEALTLIGSGTRFDTWRRETYERDGRRVGQTGPRKGNRSFAAVRAIHRNGTIHTATSVTELSRMTLVDGLALDDARVSGKRVEGWNVEAIDDPR